MEGATVAISAAEQTVLEKETIYVEKRTTFDRADEDHIELLLECKTEAFHENQTRLEELRDELRLYGIIVDIGISAAEEFGPDGVVTGTENGRIPGYDCRYRQIPQCQGANIKNYNADQIA